MPECRQIDYSVMQPLQVHPAPDFATKFTKNISKKRGNSKVFLAFFVVV